MGNCNKPDCDMLSNTVVKTWLTGDDECNAESTQYECGAVYNHNFGDRLGFRDHDCFWDCDGCLKK